MVRDACIGGGEAEAAVCSGVPGAAADGFAALDASADATSSGVVVAACGVDGGAAVGGVHVCVAALTQVFARV